MTGCRVSARSLESDYRLVSPWVGISTEAWRGLYGSVCCRRCAEHVSFQFVAGPCGTTYHDCRLLEIPLPLAHMPHLASRRHLGPIFLLNLGKLSRSQLAVVPQSPGHTAPSSSRLSLWCLPRSRGDMPMMRLGSGVGGMHRRSAISSATYIRTETHGGRA
jgi:hypothetical protein